MQAAFATSVHAVEVYSEVLHFVQFAQTVLLLTPHAETKYWVPAAHVAQGLQTVFAVAVQADC